MIKSLHGLRGIAALSVLVAHSLDTRFGGSLGVMLFFVLSGFLMAKLYLERPATPQAIGKYAVARMARIYPLFACVIIGTAAINHFTGSRIFQLDTWQVDQHLMFVGSAWTVWTIAVEFHFYAAFVLLWLLRSGGFLNNTALYIGAATMVAASLIITNSFDQINLLRYLHVFLTGMIVGIAAQKAGPKSLSIANWLLPCLLIAYFVVPSYITNPLIPGTIYADPFTLAICAGLVWSCAAGAQNLTSRFLSSPALYWLGEVSFGLYLLHRHSIWIVKEELGGFGNQYVDFAAILGLTLIFAQIAYVCIENPARKHLRKLGDAVAVRLLPGPAQAKT